MQGGTRIALPFSATLVEKIQAQPRRSPRRLVSAIRSLFTDLLLLWDCSAVLLCGIGTAFLHDAAQANPVAASLYAGHLFDDLLRASITGALLAPIILRERVLRRFDRTAAGALIKRVAALVGIVLIVAMATRLITSVPLLWVASWFVSVAGMTLAGRLMARSLLQWSAQRFGGERVAVRKLVVEEGEELGELVGEVVHVEGALRGSAIAPESRGLDGAATGGAANAEIDAIGVKGVQGAEGFGDFERGVMRKHDAA